MGSNRLVVPVCSQPLRWIVVAGVTVTIVILSLVSPPADVQSAGQSDKILHFAAYFGLAGALTYATIEFQSQPRLRSVLIFVGAVGVGLGVELLQATLPYRFFTIGDLLANTLGAGLMLLWLPIEQYVEYAPLDDYISKIG
jgi:VanZ family protein